MYTMTRQCAIKRNIFVQSCGLQTAKHYWSETRSSVPDKNVCLANSHRLHSQILTRVKKVLRYLKGTPNLNLLHADSCNATQRFEQAVEEHHGVPWR